MKPLIFITAITGLLVFTLGCLKDEISKTENTQVVQADQKQPSVYYADDWKNTKDGGHRPFDFGRSGVIYDPFKKKQDVFNLHLLDTTFRNRIDDPNVNGFEGYWDVYITTRLFKDGSTRIDTTYGESNGLYYFIVPESQYNQLAINNPYKWITVTQTNNFRSYFDEYCGKDKREFQYTILYGDNAARDYIRGDRCASNVFSYQLITIQ